MSINPTQAELFGASEDWGGGGVEMTRGPYLEFDMRLNTEIWHTSSLYQCKCPHKSSLRYLR